MSKTKYIVENATGIIKNKIVLADGSDFQVATGYSLRGPSEASIGEVWVEQVAVVKASEVIAERDRRLLATAAGYTRTERETWPVQVEEAKAFKADNTSPTPMLSRLAAARGLTVDQMADRVLALNASFADMTGAIMAAATVLVSQGPIPEDYKEAIHWP